MAYATFFSNNTYLLMAALFERLNFKKCLTNGVTVLVPNKDFQDLFYLYLVDYKKVDVKMFLRVKTLEEGMYCFKSRASGSSVNFQSLRLLIINILNSGQYFTDLCQSSRDRQALAKRLAALFMRYRLASSNKLEEWVKKEGEIQKIFINTLDTFPLLKKEAFHFHPEHDVHFFCFDAIPAIYHEILFSKKKGSLFFYNLSPSDTYWGDVVSKNTQHYLRKKFRKKQVDQRQIDLFESLTSDANPLLASFSTLYKPLYARLLDETQCFNLYSNEFFSSDLECLRSKIFLQGSQKVNGGADSTFQVTAACSKLREMQILFDALLEAFSNQDLRQKQVQVFALDIGQYLPEIQQVFCCPSSPFHVEVRSLKNTTNNLWMQTFKNFLEFLARPFNLHLLERFIFSKTFSFAHFSSEDRKIFYQEFLQKGSYRQTKENLLQNLALTDEIAFEDSERLANIIVVIDKLELLHLTVDRKSANIADWSGFFVEVIETYFQSDESAGQVLDVMFKMSELQDCSDFDFQTILDVFHDLLNKKVGVFQNQSSNAIVFCNLTLEAIVPRKRIYCLGLDEESFVRHEKMDILSDKELLEHTGIPSANQVDRACILKMILNAGDYLQFIFTNISATDGKRIDASLVLKECLHFLNLDIVEAQLLDFDASYFQEESFKSHSSFRLAQSYYQKCDIKPFETKQSSEIRVEIQKVSIDEINALLAHPLRFFAKKSLGLYLEPFEKDPLEAKEFHLSYAQTKVLVEKALILGVDKSFEEVGIHFQMATKPWLDAAKLSIQRKVYHLEHTFKKLGIGKGDLFSHEFRLDLEDQRITIVHGQIDLLTRHGLIIHEKNKMQGIFKNWAKIVLLNCLRKRGEPISSTLCFSASGKSQDLEMKDPFAALKSLLNYYQKAKKSPSPLMADNVSHFMKGLDTKGVQNSFFHDPYTELLQEQQCSLTKEIEDLCKYINV